MRRKLLSLALVALVLVVVPQTVYSGKSPGEGVLQPLVMAANPASVLSSDRGFQELRKNLKGYTLYLADHKTALEMARRGELTLRIRGEKFELVLRPETITVDPNASDRPIYLFTGHVKGHPDSSATVCIAEDTGAVVVIIRVGIKWYYLDPLKTRLGGRPVHIGYSSKDVVYRKVDLTNDVIYPPGYKPPSDGYESHPVAREQDVRPEAFPSEPTTYTIDLLAIYDREFGEKAGDPQAEIRAIVSEVNRIYGKYGIYFHIKAFKESYTSGSTACEVLGNIASSAISVADAVGADLAFVFSGKSFNEAIGCAHQYGRVAVGQMFGQGFNRVFVAAHELGHNFDADHEDADHEYTGGYNRAYSWYDRRYHTRFYTLMWNAATDEYKRPEFSDRYNHGDAYHDNARRIKETAPVIQSYT